MSVHVHSALSSKGQRHWAGMSNADGRAVATTCASTCAAGFTSMVNSMDEDCNSVVEKRAVESGRAGGRQTRECGGPCRFCLAVAALLQSPLVWHRVIECQVQQLLNEGFRMQ